MVNSSDLDIWIDGQPTKALASAPYKLGFSQPLRSGTSLEGYPVQSVHRHALHRAAEILGGPGPLANHLKVPRDKLDYWLSGELPVPTEVFLALVDLVLPERLPEMERNSHWRPLMDGAHVRTLQRALGIVVTKERLAAALEVQPNDLEKYLTGTEPLPHQAFLDALDIVAGSMRRGRTSADR